MEYLLVLTVLLPLAGAVLVWLIGAAGGGGVRGTALVTSLVTLGLAGYLVYNCQIGDNNFAVSDWVGLGGNEAAVNIHFSLGLDGLGLWLFALSALLSVTSVLVSWQAITDRPARSS